ncbi:MAG: hypothetical protein HON32_09690 [Francisellaceae bacterium]|nr:hypothetical protein [Francisellaceae bacterium]
MADDSSGKEFFDRGAFAIELSDNPNEPDNNSGPMMLCKYMTCPLSTTSKQKAIVAKSRLSSHFIGAEENRVSSVGVTTPGESDLFGSDDGKFKDLHEHNKALPNFFRHDAENPESHECFKHYHNCLIEEGDHYVWLRKTETEPFDPTGDFVGSVKHTINYFQKGKQGEYQRAGEDKLPTEIMKIALGKVKDYLAEHNPELLAELFKSKLLGSSKNGSE